ncbi:hypothetical protein JT358_03095 [Micrococcales bacterium 31B]|nr:hypothetical protein [Micrococcales bacterium 31B]
MPPTARQLFDALSQHVAPTRWWPADDPFEMMVGAVLVQNTAWRNVEVALDQVRDAGLLSPAALVAAPPDRVRDAIRPSGFMTAKARTLAGLARWTLDREARLGSDLAGPDPGLRAELLALPGIGPETADVIRLYAYDQPCFVYDTYARRLLDAAGHPVRASYEATRRALDLPLDGLSLAEVKLLHGLIVDGGKQAGRSGGWAPIVNTIFCAPLGPRESA